VLQAPLEAKLFCGSTVLLSSAATVLNSLSQMDQLISCLSKALSCQYRVLSSALCSCEIKACLIWEIKARAHASKLTHKIQPPDLFLQYSAVCKADSSCHNGSSRRTTQHIRAADGKSTLQQLLLSSFCNLADSIPLLRNHVCLL
jgi:hypothetical protein